MFLGVATHREYGQCEKSDSVIRLKFVSLFYNLFDYIIHKVCNVHLLPKQFDL